MENRHTSSALADLRSLYLKAGDLFDRQGLDPVDNSIASYDLANFKRRESVESLHAQGALLIKQVFDHTSAFIQLASEQEPTLASSANARAVVENSALACWLSDSSVPSDERIARSLALRYNNLREQQKTLATWDPSVDTRDRIDSVILLSSELGFEPVVDRKGRVVGAGRRLPSYTSLVEEVLDYEAYYRLLSGLVHANIPILRSLGYTIVDYAQDGVTIEMSLNPKTVETMCQVVAGAFSITIESKFILFGWDHSALKRELNPLLRSLNTPHSEV